MDLGFGILHILKAARNCGSHTHTHTHTQKESFSSFQKSAFSTRVGYSSI